MSNDALAQQLPRYICHKKVYALKIKAITLSKESVEITPEDENFASFPVSNKYFEKHAPEVGGYYVMYQDGYQSYSPARAFEEGYTRDE